MDKSNKYNLSLLAMQSEFLRDMLNMMFVPSIIIDRLKHFIYVNIEIKISALYSEANIDYSFSICCRLSNTSSLIR